MKLPPPLRRKKNSALGTKVFVGLSGGVDSAVSAALLKEKGYEVTGVFIRIALPGYPCPAAEDRISAMRVAAHLKIPFIEVDLSKEYEREVFAPALKEFAKGNTPNPDTLCNEKIKFGIFFDFCRKRGADYVATGHYAQVSTTNLASKRSSGLLEDPARPFGRQGLLGHLLMGVDTEKDQSYFLWGVSEEVLRHTLFPIGHLQKTQVRRLAKKFGLPNAKRPDSQGLCFLGALSLEDMLEREVPQRSGSVLSENGEKIGTHKGAAHYTLGQRHGFALSTHEPNSPAYFVVGKDVEANTITVSPNRVPKGTKTEVTLGDVNWIGEVQSGFCLARYRYRQQLIRAELQKEKNLVTLHEPHYAPLGQSLVLYSNERCLGGGVVADVTLT